MQIAKVPFFLRRIPSLCGLALAGSIGGVSCFLPACSSSSAPHEHPSATTTALSDSRTAECAKINPSSFAPLRAAIVQVQSNLAALGDGTPSDSLDQASASVATALQGLDETTSWMASVSLDASNASVAANTNLRLGQIASALEDATRQVLDGSTPAQIASSPAVGTFLTSVSAATRLAHDTAIDSGRCYVNWYSDSPPSQDPGQAPIAIPTTCAALDGTAIGALNALVGRGLANAAAAPTDTAAYEYVTLYQNAAVQAQQYLGDLTSLLQNASPSTSDATTPVAIHEALAHAVDWLEYAGWWALVAAANGDGDEILQAWERTMLAVDVTLDLEARADGCVWMNAPVAPVTTTPQTPQQILGTYVLHNPPPLTGVAGPVADTVKKFIDWAGGSLPQEREDGRNVIAAAANDPAVVSALIDEARAAQTEDQSRALLALSILGETKSQAAEDFLIDLVRQPLPSGPLAEGEDVARTAAEQLQSKAVDGIAYRNSASGNSAIFDVLAHHESVAVRAEAVRAYLYNNPDSGRRDLAAVLRAEDKVFLDRAEHGPDTRSRLTFNGQLATYLRLHPDRLPPAPARLRPNSAIDEEPVKDAPLTGAPVLPKPIIK